MHDGFDCYFVKLFHMLYLLPLCHFFRSRSGHMVMVLLHWVLLISLPVAVVQVADVPVGGIETCTQFPQLAQGGHGIPSISREFGLDPLYAQLGLPPALFLFVLGGRVLGISLCQHPFLIFTLVSHTCCSFVNSTIFVLVASLLTFGAEAISVWANSQTP